MKTKIKPKNKEEHFILEDIVFKFIFGYQRNIKYTEYLLEVLLDLKIGSLRNKIKISNSVNLEKTKYEDKGLELDVDVKFKEYNIIINLEAYTEFYDDEKIKSLSYISRIYSTNLKKGEKTYTQIDKISQINIVKGSFKSGLYTLQSISEPNKIFTNKQFYILVIRVDDKEKLDYNLIKEMKKVLNLDIEEEDNYERRTRLLKYMSLKDKNKIKEIEEKDEVIRKMNEEVYNFVNSDLAKRYYFDAKRLHRSQAKREGKKEGINFEKIRTAKSMLEDKVDIKTIMKYTNLSKNDIKELTKEIENN